MNAVPERKDFLSPFILIIVTALAVQLIGNYYAHHFLVMGRHFYTLWIILRIVIPAGVLCMLRVPVRELGLGMPGIDRRFRIVFIGMFFLLLAAFIGIYFYQGYFSSYGGSFQSLSRSKLDRFINFMVFTSSTLPGWEFLHRCFLLMGLSYVFKEKEGLDERTAVLIAMAVVWIFEVVFHFKKPVLESTGLLVGSPILSYIALRTRSVWPAFFSHLLVEILFIASLIFR